MKVIIEDAQTGELIKHELVFARSEPEEVEYDDFHEYISEIIKHIKKNLLYATPEKEENNNTNY